MGLVSWYWIASLAVSVSWSSANAGLAHLQAGLAIHAEYHTQLGRSEIILETKEKVLVIKIKYNQTAEKAINQIKEKKYYEMFLDRGLPIYLVGINFNGETRSIDDDLVELLRRRVDFDNCNIAKLPPTYSSSPHTPNTSNLTPIWALNDPDQDPNMIYFTPIWASKDPG